ncbi:MAG TPA: HEAT repeat domain-containing protein [Prolixibacteraceae bacterium]|nr:HEAT repeat domain-containing protein [Prolixibacteraceae bacterium]
MNCNEIKNRMIDYIDDHNRLSKNELIEFENHLKSCVACKNEFNQLKEINSKLDQIHFINETNELRESFLNKLENEKSKMKRISITLKLNRSIFNLAASILLLIAGSFFGYFIAQKGKISKLENEILSIKHSYTSSVLNIPTSSIKLKAISYVEEGLSLNPEFIQVLGNILNNDENVNVRLAAANALFKNKHYNEVNALLIESLKTQSEPLVQIALIDFLVKNHERQAVQNLKILIEQDGTNSIVKQHANNGLSTLL